jgi:hypothetical protein
MTNMEKSEQGQRKNSKNKDASILKQFAYIRRKIAEMNSKSKAK